MGVVRFGGAEGMFADMEGGKGVIPVGIPTGFIVGGPDGRPVLFDFDKGGKVVASGGVVMGMQSWLWEYGDRVPDDVVLLVEHFKADDGRLLMKCLDSGLLRDGKRKLSVTALANEGGLWALVELFRSEYMMRMFG
jgi:hypothetical protein